VVTSTIAVRPYHPDDLEAVLNLLRVSLGETEVNRRSPELFSWKHVDNPFGPSIILVAEDSEGIVGFRAFMRWELATKDGELIRCVRPVDTATHPRAQRQGVFRRLTMAAVEAAKEDGVDLIFNTPNPMSRAGYLAMGWIEVGKIGVLLRPKIASFFRRQPGVPTVAGSTPWTGQEEVVDRPARGLRTSRTARYLDWRFRHPFAEYVVTGAAEGMAVLRPNRRKGRRELVVSDLFGPGAGAALRQAARRTDADYLVGWFTPGTPERRQTRRAGLIGVPGLTALNLVARPLRPDLTRMASDLAHWDLALSDLELL
jgi:GNAT superfamily N-acetyltransferase